VIADQFVWQPELAQSGAAIAAAALFIRPGQRQEFPQGRLDVSRVRSTVESPERPAGTRR
jgi:hypothetical protein